MSYVVWCMVYGVCLVMLSMRGTDRLVKLQFDFYSYVRTHVCTMYCVLLLCMYCTLYAKYCVPAAATSAGYPANSFPRASFTPELLPKVAENPVRTRFSYSIFARSEVGNRF